MAKQLIGNKIREARKKAGLTQWQLANKIYISESYVALIENNKRSPSMNVLVLIAEALNLTTDQLVLDVDSRSDESFTLEWQSLIQNRTSKEIESALKMLRSYFECLDSLSD